MHPGIHVQKNEALSQRIAFFDFDGTITTKDTLMEIIRYQHGTARCYLGLILLSPVIAAWKLGILSNHSSKEKLLRHFFGNMPVKKFQQRCDAFAAEIIPTLLRKKALKEIQQLKDMGAEVVIVSASAENWISGWCRDMQLKLIGTRLAVKDGVLTGYFNGHNCHGEEKVRRIREAYDLTAYNEISCYGDTKGDKPMLSLATFAFYKPFR